MKRIGNNLGKLSYGIGHIFLKLFQAILIQHYVILITTSAARYFGMGSELDIELILLAGRLVNDFL